MRNYDRKWEYVVGIVSLPWPSGQDLEGKEWILINLEDLVRLYHVHKEQRAEEML